MVEVLTLQEQTTTQFLGEVVAFGHRRRPAGVVGEQPVQLGPVCRVGPGIAERRLEFQDGGNQRLGDEASAEVAEPAIRRRF